MILLTLQSLIPAGQKQCDDFWNTRIIKGKVPVTDPIAKNRFLIPRQVQDQIKDGEKKLIYPPSILTKMREAIHHRKELAN